jgi:pimeloyl-ACP methyl ester carboxylesterase
VTISSERERRVDLVTTDGVAISALAWPTSTGPPRATVVLVHGLAARKDHPHVTAMARRLQDLDFDVLSYDSRGHGESEGFCTLGDLERLDVEAAVEWAARRGLPTIVIGASMGGIAVLRYAAEHPELAGVVVVSSPAEWRIPLRLRAVLTAALARTRPGRRVALRRMGVRISPSWNAAETPRVLADRVTSPLAVVHGRRDALIPTRAGLEFHLRADTRRYVVLAHDMGHAFDLRGHDAICEAVEWTLTAKPTAT